MFNTAEGFYFYAKNFNVEKIMSFLNIKKNYWENNIPISTLLEGQGVKVSYIVKNK